MTFTSKLLFVALPFLVLSGMKTQPGTNPDIIIGSWANEDKTRVLEFVKQGNGYEAIIKTAKDNTLAGKKQITGITYSNGSYKGTVHLPKRGSTMPCTLVINADSSMQVSVKSGFMAKTQIWKRL